MNDAQPQNQPGGIAPYLRRIADALDSIDGKISALWDSRYAFKLPPKAPRKLEWCGSSNIADAETHNLVSPVVVADAYNAMSDALRASASPREINPTPTPETR